MSGSAIDLPPGDPHCNDWTKLGFLEIYTDRAREPVHSTGSAVHLDFYTDIVYVAQSVPEKVSHVTGGTLYTDVVYVMEPTPDGGCT